MVSGLLQQLALEKCCVFTEEGLKFFFSFCIFFFTHTHTGFSVDSTCMFLLESMNFSGI